MDPTVTVAIITSGAAFITALVGAILGFVIKGKLQRVEVNVDGKLTELTAALKRADQAEGFEVGRLAQIAETAAAAALAAAIPQVISLVTESAVKQATLDPSQPVTVRLIADEPVPVVHVEPKK
jgi:hypothetical protein